MKKLDMEQKQSILIIDDNQEDVIYLKKLLKKEYRVRSATSAEKAFKSTGTRNPPDLVLLSASMPGMDCSRFCKKLKASPATWNIPVLFLTQTANEEEESKIFKMGAADFLLKPYHPDTVAARVRTHAEIKRYRDCLENSYYQDSITLLPNKRRFEEYFDSVWGFAVRESFPFSLIKISLVDFDQYRDQYGQQAADEYLRAIAKKLSHIVRRKTDMLARTEHEEFACVLPNTRLDGAILIAEAFRSCLSSLEIESAHEGGHAFISINQGIATVKPNNVMLPKVLIAAADEALEKSISAGNNQIIGRSL